MSPKRRHGAMDQRPRPIDSSWKEGCVPSFIVHGATFDEPVPSIWRNSLLERIAQVQKGLIVAIIIAVKTADSETRHLA